MAKNDIISGWAKEGIALIPLSGLFFYRNYTDI
jgi:hypothetical protein